MWIVLAHKKSKKMIIAIFYRATIINIWYSARHALSLPVETVRPAASRFQDIAVKKLALAIIQTFRNLQVEEHVFRIMVALTLCGRFPDLKT